MKAKCSTLLGFYFFVILSFYILTFNICFRNILLRLMFVLEQCIIFVQHKHIFLLIIPLEIKTGPRSLKKKNICILLENCAANQAQMICFRLKMILRPIALLPFYFYFHINKHLLYV
jgi:hypothetical protein